MTVSTPANDENGSFPLTLPVQLSLRPELRPRTHVEAYLPNLGETAG